MTLTGVPVRLQWSLVVPVKVLARAKSRLAAVAGPHRPALALAMAADTVSAALACDEVARVIVVTDDKEAAPVLASLGAIVTGDLPGRGLNPALSHGAGVAADRWPGSPVVALAGDLPALRPRELAAGLHAASQWRHAFVPDTGGSGTTLYAACSVTVFSPRFGPGSAARHRDAGAAEILLPGLVSLRRDVDAPSDLREATGLGVGPRTLAVVAKLGWFPQPAA